MGRRQHMWSFHFFCSIFPALAELSGACDQLQGTGQTPHVRVGVRRKSVGCGEWNKHRSKAL